METRRAAPLASWLTLGAALFAAAVLLARHGRFLHDDAFIVLRYVDHLLAGEGPVWNPGERVEGFTSAPWFALVSAAGAVGAPLRYAAQGLGVAGLAGWVALLSLRAGGPGRWAALLPATSLPCVVWAVGGLETVPYAALAAAAVLAHDARVRGGGAGLLALTCAGLAALRPEGLLFAMVPVLERASAGDRRAALRAGAATAATLGALTLSRWAYYGALVPNSARAKGRIEDLPWDFFGQYLRDNVLWVLLLAVALLVLAWAEARRRTGAAWLLGSLAYLLSLAAAGGDHMPHARVLVPVVGVASALFALGLDSPRTPPTRRLLGGCLAGLVLLQGAIALLLPPTVEDGASHTGAYVGIFLQDLLPPGSVVALNSAGATPYYAPDLRFIDMLGLNDAHIASAPVPPLVLPMQRMPGHRLGDGAYVLSRRPDAILLGPANGDTRAWFYSDAGILADPAFPSDYAPVVADLDFDTLRPRARRELPPWRGIPGEGGTRLTFFVRRGTPAEKAVQRLSGGPAGTPPPSPTLPPPS